MPAYRDSGDGPAAPIALVSIGRLDRSHNVASVPMLIDTGSDATLLPRVVVRWLGIEPTGETYRTESYDGSVSELEVVEAGVTFLDRRYLGHYLLLDAEIGIPGRDILNHVRLLLDGPGLAWREIPASSSRP